MLQPDRQHTSLDNSSFVQSLAPSSLQAASASAHDADFEKQAFVPALMLAHSTCPSELSEQQRTANFLSFE
jgi:hypothetical protein